MQLHRALAPLSLACLVAAQAHAAPTVSQASGTFSDGSSVTITGSAFGTKPSSSPLVWDTFEKGTVGNKVLTSPAIIGQWQQGAGYDNGVYSNAVAHAGRQSVKMTTQGGLYDLSMAQNGQFSVVYMDWWVYINYYDNRSRNFKPWRLYGDNDVLQTNAVIMCNSSGMSVENESGTSGFWWDSMSYNKDSWQHYQVMLKESSSPGSADGVVEEYINGQLVSKHTGVVTRTGSSHWDQIRIGHYWASDGISDCPSNSGADVYLDSVYVDTTWARVEIGNASTYSASTTREVQIPANWSSGSIQITVNQGSFPAGSKAYLYVTDSSGNVNAYGYPITIGGTSSGGSTTTVSTVPNPPTNVTVN